MYFANIAIVLTRQKARFVGALFLFNEIFKLRDRVNNFFFDISGKNQLIYNNILLLSNHGSALFFFYGNFTHWQRLLDRKTQNNRSLYLREQWMTSLIILRRFVYAIIKALVTQMGGKFGAIFSPSPHYKVKLRDLPNSTRKPLCLPLLWTHWDKLNNHRSLSESCAWLRLSMICY